jgi:hypothetical protein
LFGQWTIIFADVLARRVTGQDESASSTNLPGPAAGARLGDSACSLGSDGRHVGDLLAEQRANKAGILGLECIGWNEEQLS